MTSPRSTEHRAVCEHTNDEIRNQETPCSAYNCIGNQLRKKAATTGTSGGHCRHCISRVSDCPSLPNKPELCQVVAHAGVERIFRRAPPSRSASGCSTDSPHELCCPARGDPRLLLDRVRCDSPAAGGRCCKCSRRVRTGWCSPTCVSVGRSLLDDVEGRGGGSRCTV